MTVFLILAFLGLLAALERFGTPASLAALRFRGSTDRILAEPGEVLTWTSSVENHSRFPIPFVRLQLPFPADAKPEDSPLWKKAHLRDGVQGWYVEEKLSLPPRRSITRTVRFSLSERGIYTVGKYRMAAGDLLGFREDGDAVPLDLDTVLRFYGENKDVQAQTAEAVYTVRERLYELERRLAGHPFARVSHSEIVNLKRVTSLDLSLTGTIRITLTGGVTVYVSRRYVKKMKEVLGL